MGVRLYHYQGNGDGGPTWELYCIITRVLCSLKKKKIIIIIKKQLPFCNTTL